LSLAEQTKVSRKVWSPARSAGEPAPLTSSVALSEACRNESKSASVLQNERFDRKRRTVGHPVSAMYIVLDAEKETKEFSRPD